MLLAVHVPAGVPIQQIDDFPATLSTGETETVVIRGKSYKRDKQREFERSIAGAIHVRPFSTLCISEDEYEWIKSHHKALGVKIQKLAMPKPRDDKAAPKDASAEDKKSSGKKSKAGSGS